MSRAHKRAAGTAWAVKHSRKGGRLLYCRCSAGGHIARVRHQILHRCRLPVRQGRRSSQLRACGKCRPLLLALPPPPATQERTARCSSHWPGAHVDVNAGSRQPACLGLLRRHAPPPPYPPSPPRTRSRRRPRSDEPAPLEPGRAAGAGAGLCPSGAAPLGRAPPAVRGRRRAAAQHRPGAGRGGGPLCGRAGHPVCGRQGGAAARGRSGAV